MFSILANPITLLCLGVVFLLVSLLFFYFKRTTMILEKTQMEQARILQAFISNMDMSRGLANQSSHSYLEHQRQQQQQQQQQAQPHSSGELINVSDDSDSDTDGEEDSDTDDDNDDESNSDGVSDSDMGNEQQHIIQIGGIETIDLDDHLANNGIKVIQLQENNLEEVSMGEFLIPNLDNSSDEDSDIESDIDSDDEDDVVDHSKIIGNYISGDNKKATHDTDTTKHMTNITSLNIDVKSLNVQALRQLAIDKQLIKLGDKKSKKELLNLLGGNK